jgi:hypothetical protein
MYDYIFSPCDILLPANADMSLWSIIACDQFSSEPGYWKDIENKVGNAPSALRLMLPEAYLGINKPEAEAKKISSAMRDYLKSDVFMTVPDSYIYIERRLPGGKIRKGLLGALDLEYYDYSKGSSSIIRATEGTVEDRLPPRVAVREQASLEMPHIIVFIDDPEDKIIGSLSAKAKECSKLYDFDLLGDGGHISGWQFGGGEATQIKESFSELSDDKALQKKYGGAAADPVLFAIGDGNHSLATAKLCWEGLKKTLPAEELKSHPARFSLVEIINLHDNSVEFEPIHRVIFGTENDDFITEAGKYMKKHPYLVKQNM